DRGGVRRLLCVRHLSRLRRRGVAGQARAGLGRGGPDARRGLRGAGELAPVLPNPVPRGAGRPQGYARPGILAHGRPVVPACKRELVGRFLLFLQRVSAQALGAALDQGFQPPRLETMLGEALGRRRSLAREPVQLCAQCAFALEDAPLVGREQALAVGERGGGPALLLQLLPQAVELLPDRGERPVDRVQRPALLVQLLARETAEHGERVHQSAQSPPGAASAGPRAAASRATSSSSVLRSSTSCASSASRAGRTRIASSISGSLPWRYAPSWISSAASA